MNIFTPQHISKMTENCDERISSVQSKLDKFNVYGKILSLAGSSFKKEIDKDKYVERMKNYENNIKLIKVEKLVYITLGIGATGIIFQKLFQKYNDLIAESYDFSGEMVRLDGIKEQEYLEYVKESLKQREYIQKLCIYGEKR